MAPGGAHCPRAGVTCSGEAQCRALVLKEEFSGPL